MMLSWDDSLQVKLIDTNGSIDVSIAEDLVSKGLAKYNAKKMPASKGNSSESMCTTEALLYALYKYD